MGTYFFSNCCCSIVLSWKFLKQWLEWAVARVVAVEWVIKSFRSECGMCRNLVSLLTSRGLPLGAKGRLYSTYVCSVMLSKSETLPIKVEDLTA